MLDNRSSKVYQSKGWTIQGPPPIVGYLLWPDNVKIGLTKKPKWFHRKMIEWIFGWKWEDKQ